MRGGTTARPSAERMAHPNRWFESETVEVLLDGMRHPNENGGNGERRIGEEGDARLAGVPIWNGCGGFHMHHPNQPLVVLLQQ